MGEFIRYWLASVLSRILPLRFSYWVGLRIADFYWRTHHDDRAAVTSNLATIYRAQGVEPGSDVLAGTARKTFQYYGKYIVDFFRYARLSQREVERLVSVEHMEYFREAYDRDQGVLLLTAHFGNWEVGGAVVAALGYPVNAIFLPERMRNQDRFFRKMRARRGIRPIPLGHAAKGILRCLARGEAVAILGDRDFTVRDDRVEFFGKPARMPRGPARLALKTGTPIVPAFMVRQVDDTFMLRFHPPLYPADFVDEQALRQAIAQILEKEIGAQPYQWFIFDDFWADADRAQGIHSYRNAESGHA
jgi:KDO2-lipid IV(A) lauroyltransferase